MIDEVLRALSVPGWSFATELELQSEIELRLRAARLSHRREVPLGPAGRPDFVVYGDRHHLAIEVKVGGSRAALLEQVDRYAEVEAVGAILVVTAKAAHDLPDEVRGKPVRRLFVSAAFGGGRSDGPAPVGRMIRAVDGWALTLQPHAMVRFKRCFPAVSAHQFGVVLLDDRPETCRELRWFLERFPVAMSALDRVHLDVRAAQHERRVAAVRAVLSGTVAPRERVSMAIPPRPYQSAAADAALLTGGLLVGDELGLGKTVTAIAMLVEERARPALVVVPTHLPTHWTEKIQQFAPDLRTHVIRKGTPYDVTRPPRAQRRDSGDAFVVPEPGDPWPFPDVLVCTWSKLAGWAETLAPVVRSVVYDEAQELRHGHTAGGSAKTAAAYHVSSRVDVRLGLSASPVYNRGAEIFSVIEAIRPGTLGTREEFLREWCVQSGMHHAVSDPKALGAHLREIGVMVRRTREEVGRELPAIRHVPMLIEADLQRLDEARAEVAALARMILGDELQPLERGRAAREIDWKLRQATGLAKAPHVAAFVKALLQDGRKRVLLFGWHHQVYAIWADLLARYGVARYTGTESQAEKLAALEAFRSGDAAVLMMSLRSGTGIDGLQHVDCTDVVFGELDWSPQVHYQGIGRLHRDGQEQPVTAWFPHCDNGSDPVMLEVLGIKRMQSEGILDPSGLESSPSVEPDRARELARRVLA